MCGRFALMDCPTQLQGGKDSWEPKINITPSSQVPFMRTNLVWEVGEWGFAVQGLGKRVINVRSETVFEKPLFQSLWPNMRCVIPATAFYEWHGDQPYVVRLAEGERFFFGALYRFVEHRTELCILTEQAGSLLGKIHPRKPFLFSSKLARLWLKQEVITTLCESELQLYPVTRAIGKADYQGADALEAIPAQRELF